MPSDCIPGRRVHLRVPILDGNGKVYIHAGIVMRHLPDRKGVLMCPDGFTRSFGWGYEELEMTPRRTAWEMILSPQW